MATCQPVDYRWNEAFEDCGPKGGLARRVRPLCCDARLFTLSSQSQSAVIRSAAPLSLKRRQICDAVTNTPDCRNWPCRKNRCDVNVGSTLRRRRSRAFGDHKVCIDGAGDTSGDFVLNANYIVEFFVKAVGPQRRPVLRRYKLRIDTQALVPALHAPPDNISNIEFATNLRGCNVLVPISECGIPRNNKRSGYARQVCC